jgi:LPPG:FO 2-phospho-L-lactate transferase
MDVDIVALAGGVGAGKFLRGLVRVVPPSSLTVIVNTGDDIRLHGLHISPDLDSVTYWLAGVADRERGWGRSAETFRATEELRAFGSPDAWFGLGDLDLATHLFRTRLLAAGATLSEATAAIARRFDLEARLLPMTDERVETRVEAVDGSGALLDLHFQEYWVRRGGRDRVKAVRYEHEDGARPAPGVIEAIAEADAVVLCPSNPIASIDPILGLPEVSETLERRRDRVVGISPIVAGAPLRGMADRFLPVAGVEVSAAGVAHHYGRRIGAWVIDRIDRALAGGLVESGLRVEATDTIMVDDDAAGRLAEVALELARRPA